MTRFGRTLSTPLCAALAPLAIAILAGSASASTQQAEPWPIKEFEVVAVEPAGAVDGTRRIDFWVEQMVRIIRTETDYDPDFPPIWNDPTVSLPDIEETKQEIEATLRAAAGELEAWGFSPPVLEPVVKNEAGADAYRVYLVTERPGVAGRYHAEPCAFGIREAVLVLNADLVLGGDGLLTDRGVETVVHELVHAAQFSLPAYSCSSGYPGQWITEGTARAIGFDVLRQLSGAAAFRGMYEAAWGARMYSERLPVSLAERAYRTNSFWRYLAEYTQSRPTFPGPGATWPTDYTYLPRLLGKDFSPRDCYGEGAPCDAELRWIDAGLRDEFSVPLRELYARFIQVYAQYGEERVHSTEGGNPATMRKNWLGRSFAHEEGLGCTEVVLRPEAEDRQREFVVSIFDVAARCWEIDLDAFFPAPSAPADGTGMVTLVVTAASNIGTKRLLEQLTAVMADESRRVDKAVVQTTADVPRATWYYDHGGLQDKPVFLLTNVADSPDATELASLSVTFTALQPFATMISSTPGPSGADVDQPLEVRFDRGLGGIATDAPGPSSQYPFDPGLLQPCWLIWDHLHNAQQDPLRGDGLSLRMVHEGPIGPGDYPLADGTRVVGMDPWPAGRPLVGFGLGFVNEPPAQQLQSFTGIAGTLTVESVVGDRFVTGTLHVTGENGRARDIARGWEEPPPNYLPGAVIRVEFGLLMRDPADPAEHGAVTRCLTPEPSGGGAGIAHGGDSADGADGAPEGRGGSPTDPEGAAPDPQPADPAGGAPGASDPNPGEQGADAAADPPADAPADPANSFAVAQEQLGPGEARWVSVQAQERPDLSFSGSDVDGSAGAFFSCFGPASSAHLGLTEGESAQDAELGLVVITATGIAAGATGTYAIDQVVYQAGGGALDWRGPVTLELSRHDASTDPTARRVTGRILGLRVVDRETDAPTPVEAEFDVNAACTSLTDR